MKRLILLCLLFAGLSAYSQQLKIDSFKMGADEDNSSKNVRRDLFDTPCAVIKVIIDDDIVRVDGNVIGDIVKKGREKWIYVTEGTKRIDIVPSKHLPISIMFPDYGFKNIKG